MHLRVQLSGKGIKSDTWLIPSWGQTDTREVGNSIFSTGHSEMRVFYLFCHLLPEFQSRTWHALGVRLLTTTVLIRPQSLSKVLSTHFLLALKKHSIFTVALLYKKHFRKHAFTQRQECFLPAWQGTIPPISLWARGSYWNIKSWAPKATIRVYDPPIKLGW